MSVSLPRSLVIVALVGALLACVGAWLSHGQATRAAATYSMATAALDELGLLAGLRDEDGELLRDEPMAVELITDGGPMWALDSVARAVAGSTSFRVDSSAHLLRTEVVEARGGIALQLHLFRAGWELREPQPRRARIAAWAAVIAGLLGAVAAVFARRLSVGLLTAGLVAQLLLFVVPVPDELLAPAGLVSAWSEGPLIDGLLGWIRGLSTGAMGVLLAVMAGSLVLVAFDHSKNKGDDDLGLGVATLVALTGSLGAIAWIEAASRGGLMAACDLRFGAWAGWLVVVGLIVAWLPAIRVGREAWRARAS